MFGIPKRVKLHELPAHHNLEAWLHAYLEAARIGAEKKSPLFRSAIGRTGMLSDRPLLERNAVTGWLPHTTRAAITRLRQRGYDIRLAEVGSRKVYRLASGT